MSKARNLSNTIRINSAVTIPSGTTAERPANPAIGTTRYNTDTDCLENYTATGWLKVSIPLPTITSISGTIYAGVASTLTFAGTKFGTGQGVVTFISGATSATVNVTPSSDSALSVSVPAAIYGLSGGTSVDIKFTNSDNGVSNTIAKTVQSLPTGGTITTASGYRYHTFNSSSDFVVPSGFTATADYLVVAGGGGGGRYGGGAGAGGYRSVTGYSLSASTTSITIGAGGAGWVGDAQSGGNGGTGGNSSFGAITVSNGGGGGGNYGNPTGSGGASGGSGGGAGTSNGGGSLSGGSGTSGQGNAGGSATGNPGVSHGGGGGGASVAGASGTSTGQGGNGSTWLNGTTYAGGGSGSQITTNLAGGTGGGGTGFTHGVARTSAIDGVANTGGGGGGGRDNAPSAGNGGSGIVIIRYAIPT